MKKTVVAATHREFVDWCHKQQMSEHAARYAPRAEHLRGVQAADLVVLPGWDGIRGGRSSAERREIRQMIQMIEARG